MRSTPETHPRDEADLRFAERVAQSYRPEPFDRVRAARFDAALRERIARRVLVPRWLPALACAAAAFALLWWAGPAATPTPVADASPEAAGPGAAVALDPVPRGWGGWEGDVLFADGDETLEHEAYLPDEYQAIAYAFLDGP